MNGNIVAQLALLLWVPLSLLVASLMPPRRAALAILIGGTLFLPERVAYDFPVIPALDKRVIASLGAYLGCLLTKPDVVLGKQQTNATRYLMVLMVVNVMGTVATNGDALRFGPLVLPGLSAYDSVSMLMSDWLNVALPFFLGQTLFRSCDDLRDLLRALVIGALAYVPFVILEARLSPIFHIKVYGFFQHSFEQTVRDGGFRAFVFMSHGLTVAFFMSQSITSLAGLARIKATALGVPSKLLTVVLTVALISCKSLGAFIYAGLSVPLVWFASIRMQLRVASYLSIAVMVYPLLRMFDWISTEWFLEQARSASADRAQSLQFRFVNEGMLISKVQEKLFFGWGTWGRNLLYDFRTGRDVTIVDGEWILQFSAAGAAGFLITFGLLLWPVFYARRADARMKLQKSDGQILATVALLLAFTGLDLVPNSLSHALPYVMAGALMSVSAGILQRGRLPG